MRKGVFLLCVAKHINLLTFVQSSTPIVYLLFSLLFRYFKNTCYAIFLL